jgi:protein-arginine kinase activator protein McsA
MDKSFDDLFNEFFNRRKTDSNDRMKEEARKIIESLTNFVQSDKTENLERMFDQNLGEPDEIENFQEGHLYFERRVWHTETGDIVKLLVSDDPTHFITKSQDKKPSQKVVQKTLEIQLEEALAVEDFEKAAELRDLLNPPKRRGRPKKQKIQND